ncbi:MAG TPA: substrate-binding domain-containing protein [Burkholderiales bacterium]
MPQAIRRFALAWLACCLAAAPCRADELVVFSVEDARAVLQDLAPAFAAAGSPALRLEFGGAAALQRRIRGGEAFDVVLLPAFSVAPLAAGGEGPLREPQTLARSPMGIAIAAGAARPALRSAAQLRAVLLGARRIAYDREGPCGERFLLLLENLGVAQAVAPRLLDSGSGTPAPAAQVAAGHADLGIETLRGIGAARGAELLAPWPPEVQCQGTIAGALSAKSKHAVAGRALLRLLASEAGAAAFRAHGQQPARDRSVPAAMH